MSDARSWIAWDEIDEFDDRDLVREVGEVLNPGGRLGGFPLDLGVGSQFLQERGHCIARLAATVVLLDRGLDRLGIGHHRHDLVADREPEFVEQRRVQGVGQGDLQDGTVQGIGDGLVGLGRRRGHRLQGGLVRRPGPQVDHLGAEVLGHHLKLGIRVEDAEVGQHLADRFAAALHLLVHFVELQVVQQSAVANQGEKRVGGVVGHGGIGLPGDRGGRLGGLEFLEFLENWRGPGLW